MENCGWVRAIRDYDPRESDELVLKNGDRIWVDWNQEPDQGWYQGQLGESFGLFHENCIEVVEQQEEYQQEENYNEENYNEKEKEKEKEKEEEEYSQNSEKVKKEPWDILIKNLGLKPFNSNQSQRQITKKKFEVLTKVVGNLRKNFVEIEKNTQIYDKQIDKFRKELHSNQNYLDQIHNLLDSNK
ncbi:protein nervous wreck [Anaeramoeba flamelloides]|uniref:Protein nervous wreck n=1 Tax=Anaeramoeba flamelloides TaxID=1746091 RepID=A0AAV7ZPI5_9EUKA|nr:protein nervous wreck [Anaeramoeba flamelloides]